MTGIKTFVICLVVASLYTGARGQAPTASELLQKGIYLEETVGDLEGAMRTYKQVTQMAVESRASAAQAEYRMGSCLQKKGQEAEAIKTFQNLIKDYPEQADVVARAKAFLPAEPKPVSATANPCQGLEDLVVIHPEEVALREKTTECYFSAQVKAQFTSSAARELENSRVKHVLWLVQHVPDKVSFRAESSRFSFPENYTRIKLEWTNQVMTHFDNANVLVNAVQFIFVDDRKKGEEFAAKIHSLDPADLAAAHDLAKLVENMRNRIKPEEIQAARQLSQSKLPLLNLRYMADDAFDAGENVKAQKYAEELSLTDDAELAHHGNVLLGRLALKNGNVEEAKKRLLAAGKSRSPALWTFGPNMSLALELLQKGEQDVVLQYFDECQEFWKSGSGKLEQWRQAVHQGRIPEFGGNLLF
jgi:tetratricopeptide (TPR) repeat protein